MTFNWQVSLEPALQQSRKERKPLLIDFWSPGCKGCAAFDSFTYENEAVIRELQANFVGLKFNTNDPDPESREILRSVRPLWTPTLVFLDGSKCELGRLVGYVPAEEFLGHLRLNLAKYHLLHAEPGLAHATFASVAQENQRLAPEALYWAGVAAFYKDGKSLQSLTNFWEKIGAEYRADPWWDRANVL